MGIMLGNIIDKVPTGEIERVELYLDMLWLFYHNGKPNKRGSLIALDMARKEVTHVEVPEDNGIIDFAISGDGGLLAATDKNELWSYHGGWERLSKIPVKPLEKIPDRSSVEFYDKLPAITKGWPWGLETDVIHRMVKLNGEAIFLGTSGIMRYSLNTGEWRRTDLYGWVLANSKMSAAITSDEKFYLGTYNGEFGGQLMAIDMATGYYGLVSHYQNVTSLISDPWDEHGVMFSDGCKHLGNSLGGIYRVRGKEKTCLFDELAVYDLKFDGHCCWALTRHNLLKVEKDRVEKLNTCKPELFCGVLLSTPAPGVFIVRSDIETRAIEGKEIYQRGFQPQLAVRRGK